MNYENRIKTKLMISIILNTAIVIFEIISLIMTFSQNGFLGTIQYYTNDSNIIALFASGILLYYSIMKLIKKTEIPQWVRMLKYIATCCLTITFFVVVFILSPMMKSFTALKMMLFSGSMLYHHTICPLIAMISFIFFENDKPYTLKDTINVLIPTIIYAVIAIILNICYVLDGPYFFLQVRNQPFYMSIIWCIVVLGFAYTLDWALMFFNKLVGKNRRKIEK